MFEIVEAIQEFNRTPHVETEIETVEIRCINQCGESIVVDVNDDGSYLEDRNWRRVGNGWLCPFAETD